MLWFLWEIHSIRVIRKKCSRGIFPSGEYWGIFCEPGEYYSRIKADASRQQPMCGILSWGTISTGNVTSATWLMIVSDFGMVCLGNIWEYLRIFPWVGNIARKPFRKHILPTTVFSDSPHGVYIVGLPGFRCPVACRETHVPNETANLGNTGEYFLSWGIPGNFTLY